MSKPVRILAYDATPAPFFSVARTWIIGAALFGWRFDHVVAATSWYDVLNKCREIGSDVELHFWGHGSPGQAFIGKQVLPRSDKRWKHVRLLWLRCCSTMHGSGGIAMVKALRKHGTAVVGHLNIIGPMGHSYLVGCAPGQPIWWTNTEVDPRSWSRPWQPRTVSPLRMRLPAWWAQATVPDGQKLIEPD
jgi:hypothetical protein